MTTTENRLRFFDPFNRLIGARDLYWQLVAQAAIEPGAAVLDIGTGTGNVLLLAKRAVPQATPIGLDPDPAALAIAARKAGRARLAVQLDRGSADRLPYADASIDRVLSSLMLQHLSGAEKDSALREVRRVLTPRGSLHLVDMDGDPRNSEPVARLLSRRHRHGAGHGYRPAHGHGPVAPSVLTLLGAAGFGDATEVGQGSTRLGPHTFYRASGVSAAS